MPSQSHHSQKDGLVPPVPLSRYEWPSLTLMWLLWLGVFINDNSKVQFIEKIRKQYFGPKLFPSSSISKHFPQNVFSLQNMLIYVLCHQLSQVEFTLPKSVTISAVRHWRVAADVRRLVAAKLQSSRWILSLTGWVLPCWVLPLTVRVIRVRPCQILQRTWKSLLSNSAFDKPASSPELHCKFQKVLKEAKCRLLMTLINF